MPIKKLIEIFEMNQRDLFIMLLMSAPVVGSCCWWLLPSFREAGFPTMLMLTVGLSITFCGIIRFFFMIFAYGGDFRMPGPLALISPLYAAVAVSVSVRNWRNQRDLISCIIMFYIFFFIAFWRSRVWRIEQQPPCHGVKKPEDEDVVATLRHEDKHQQDN